MDPAVKAAAELNAIFGRLEVPCEVCVTSAEGKHMKATADLAEGLALVEEVPIVSWPCASFLHLNVPFCFHCLRLATHQLAAPQCPSTLPSSSSSSSSTTPASGAASLPAAWTRCAQCASCFCSPACQKASARVHRLLCAALPELRSGTAPPPSSPASAAAATSGISVEALARCVAWVVHRLSTVVEQQKITHDMLQADYNAQLRVAPTGRATPQQALTTTTTAAATAAATASASSSTAAAVAVQPAVEWSADSLSYQLFSQVVAPFSRLISPPDSVTFDGVSLPAWMARVRSLLADKCVKVLLLASGAPLATLPVRPLEFPEEGSAAPTATPLHWAEALMGILFSTDTLRTLVGQMVLNAHGVNDFVLPAGASTTHAFEWVLKGAGLYALLSSFNHSCEPNAAVSCVDDTHEIVLKTTRAIAVGEEITITYIPLTEAATVAERRRQLKNYFFTCRCPRCVREAKA